jgi:hypothetical protein
MHTIWIHQVYVLAEAASMPGAIQALDIAFPCDDGKPRDPAHPEYYAAKYSGNGQLPATHYGAAFVVTETIRQSLESMGLDTTPGITYWRASNPEGILAASSLPADAAKVGQPWAWENCLASMSLQPIHEPKPQ